METGKERVSLPPPSLPHFPTSFSQKMGEVPKVEGVTTSSFSSADSEQVLPEFLVEQAEAEKDRVVWVHDLKQELLPTPAE